MITGIRACSASDPAQPAYPSGSGRQPTTPKPWVRSRRSSSVAGTSRRRTHRGCTSTTKENLNTGDAGQFLRRRHS